MPTRFFLLEPPRHAGRERPERSSSAPAAREYPRTRRAASRRLPPTCTPPSPPSCRAGQRHAPSSSGTDSGASHINHMPSHTWNEVGRWGDSVCANLAAWHSDQKAAIGQGFAIYPEHNLHMLLYAASYDGQGAIAMRAGKDYTKLTGESFYEVLTLIRFGRFDEVLEVTNRPKADIQGGLWDFAQGYAHLKQGNTDFATLYLARVTKAAATLGHVPRAYREGSSRHRSRHPGRRDTADGRRPQRCHCCISACGSSGGARLRRAGAAPVLGVSLARRCACGEQALRRGREGLPDRTTGSPPQRLVASPAAGARRSRDWNHPM